MTTRMMLAGSLATLWACEPTEAPPPSFERVVQEVFEPSCATTGCHSATSGAGDLFLAGERAFESATDAVCSDPQARALGLARVVPGQPGASFLYLKMTDPGNMGAIMPPADSLTAQEIALVEAWIEAGAER